MTRMVARVLPTPVRYSAPYEYISAEMEREAAGAELAMGKSTSGMSNTAGAQLSCDRSVTSQSATVQSGRAQVLIAASNNLSTCSQRRRQRTSARNSGRKGR